MRGFWNPNHSLFFFPANPRAFPPMVPPRPPCPPRLWCRHHRLPPLPPPPLRPPPPHTSEPTTPAIMSPSRLTMSSTRECHTSSTMAAPVALGMPSNVLLGSKSTSKSHTLFLTLILYLLFCFLICFVMCFLL